jgi:glycosyltransferase involved in cell wall biosynthesis
MKPESLPLLTVGIPVFNEEKNISETIESIINQSYSNILIYISNNYSSDNTIELINNYSKFDNRISLYNQKEKLSAIENFNFLIEKAKTKYFLFVGGHDKISQDCIKTAIEFLETQQNEKIVLAYPFAKLFGKAAQKYSSDPNSDIVTSGLSKKDSLIKILKNTSWGTAIYGFYRTTILKNVLIDKTYDSELVLFFKLALRGEIMSLENSIYLRREDKEETFEEAMIRYKKELLFSKDQFSIIDSASIIIKSLIPSEINYYHKILIINQLFKRYSHSLISPKFLLNIFKIPFEYLSIIFILYLKNLPFGIYKLFRNPTLFGRMRILNRINK